MAITKAFQQSTAVTLSKIEVSKVVKNTYMLLSLTILFSAFMAYVAIVTRAAPLNIFVLLIGVYGTMFLIHKYKNSSIGILLTFVFTGLLGYSLGPILSYFFESAAGAQTVFLALAMTGGTFLGLSGYALVTGKNFSFLGGTIFTGSLILIGAMVLGIFFNSPVLQLTISAGFVALSSMSILYYTSAMINQGEQNYVIIAVGLYVSIYNLFLSLLHILSVFRGE